MRRRRPGAGLRRRADRPAAMRWSRAPAASRVRAIVGGSRQLFGRAVRRQAEVAGFCWRRPVWSVFGLKAVFSALLEFLVAGGLGCQSEFRWFRRFKIWKSLAAARAAAAGRVGTACAAIPAHGQACRRKAQLRRVSTPASRDRTRGLARSRQVAGSRRAPTPRLRPRARAGVEEPASERRRSRRAWRNQGAIRMGGGRSRRWPAGPAIPGPSHRSSASPDTNDRAGAPSASSRPAARQRLNRGRPHRGPPPPAARGR